MKFFLALLTLVFSSPFYPNMVAKAEDEAAEQGSRAGPDKGVVEADEHKGLRLAPEAIKSFGISSRALEGSGPWRVPTSAILNALEEKNIYRLRDGFLKRIDFKEVGREAGGIVITSSDLRSGDGVVIAGVSFLRIAELTSLGSEPTGHSH